MSLGHLASSTRWHRLVAGSLALAAVVLVAGQLRAQAPAASGINDHFWVFHTATSTPGSTPRVSASFSGSTVHMEVETQIYRDPSSPVAVGNPLAQWIGSYSLRGDKVFMNFDSGDTLRGTVVEDKRRPGKRTILLDFGPIKIGLDEQ